MKENSMDKIQSRTDLALELKEDLDKESYTDGIRVKTKIDMDHGIQETYIQVETEEASKRMGKAIGTYITLESEALIESDESYHEEMSEALYQILCGLMGKFTKVLVAGLGNSEVTPDALGPMVIQNLFVTRHLKKHNIIEDAKELSAVSPGVMAQTGMETGEILKGIITETKPEALVVIDALAARSVTRLNKTIQISNTGIAPGSGVGNHRQAISEETMGIPVIAIGVPTVISVPTIVNDSMETMLKALGNHAAGDAAAHFSDQERYELACEILEPYLAEMFVTPKNIDEAVKCISYTISEAINQFNAKDYFMPSKPA